MGGTVTSNTDNTPNRVHNTQEIGTNVRMLLPNQVSNVEMAVRHARNSVLFVILCFMFQTARKIYVPMFTVFSETTLTLIPLSNNFDAI